MTLNEIIQQVQKAANDIVGSDTQRLWKLEEWAEYANRAVNLLCEELLLITDSSTAAVCNIAVVAGTRSYLFDQRILQFNEIRYSLRTRPLNSSNTAEFAQRDPQWRTAKGVPDSYALDNTTGYITLNKEPETNATINMTVKRSPLVDLVSTSLTASPEIKAQYHKRLKNYMLFEAFSKPDTETLDTAKAKKHYELWLRDKSEVQDQENRLKQGSKSRYRGYF